MKKTIVFAGGGTLGHVMPAIPVMKMLHDKGYRLYFIASSNGIEEAHFSKNNYPFIEEVYYLKMSGFYRKITYKNITTIIRYIKAKHRLKKIYSKIKPIVVIGMGGYVGGVAIEAARAMKIKTAIHEQNRTLGFVNRYLSSRVDLTLLTYPITKLNDAQIVGNPRMSEFKYNIKKVKPKTDILVVGGSGGAKVLNEFFIAKQDYFKEKKYRVKMITGKKYYDEIKALLHCDNIEVVPFVDNILPLFGESKLVISRSGATTISEVIGSQMMAIFVPSPNVANNHQYYNAEYYYQLGCCELVKEEELESKMLSTIDKLLSPYERMAMEVKLKEIANVDPLLLFVKAVEDLVDKR